MESHTKTQESFQAISQAKTNPIEFQGMGMMPVTPSVPRMPPQRTPPPRRSNLVPPQRTAHSSPPPAQRMSIRQQQQHGPPMPMSGRGGPLGGPTLMTSPRPPVVVSTPVGQRRYDDGAAGGVKSPALMSQYLEPPPMKPKFGTQVNWNPSHFVPSIPSPLNRAQQELSCQR